MSHSDSLYYIVQRRCLTIFLEFLLQVIALWIKSKSFDNIILSKRKCYLPPRVVLNGPGTCPLLNSKQKATIHKLKFPFWVRQYIGSLRMARQFWRPIVFKRTMWHSLAAQPDRKGIHLHLGQMETDRTQTLESLEFHLWISMRRPFIRISIFHFQQNILYGITLEHFTYTLLLA